MTNEVNSMEELLQEYDVKRISSGDILKGKVIDINDKEVMVNINYAFDGMITREELTHDDRTPSEVVNVGDELEVYVISPNDGEGYESTFASEGGGVKQSFALPATVNVIGIKAYDSLTKEWSWLGGEDAIDSLDYFTKTEEDNLQVFVHNRAKVGERELRIYITYPEV